MKFLVPLFLVIVAAAEEKKESKYDINCEVCQTIFFAGVKKYAGLTKADLSRLGGKDGAAQDTITTLCPTLNEYAEKASLDLSKFIKTCEKLIVSLEDSLEAGLPKGTPEKSLREKHCKKRCPNGLWADDDLPTMRKSAADLNAEEGTKFLDENKQKDGVVELPSGLQYKVLSAGKGAVHPTTKDRVKCHYKGTLIDGVEFDSSYTRGQPATFGVTQVIKGWTEALQLMVRGDIWELYIPFYLAYGQRGSPPKIPGGSTLIFKIEVLGIEGVDPTKDEEEAEKAAEKEKIKNEENKILDEPEPVGGELKVEL